MMNIIFIAFALFISTLRSAGCPPDKTLCNGVCKNLEYDSNNCGACGYVCDNGGYCSEGRCLCPIGYAFCSPGIIGRNCSCCPDVCSGPGAPLWSNTAHGGGCPGYRVTNLTVPSITSGQECCRACKANINCVQWAWNTPRHPFECQHDTKVDDKELARLGFISQDHCVNDIVNVAGTDISAGGRCQSTQIDECYPRNLPTFPRNLFGDTCLLQEPFIPSNPCCGTPITPNPTPPPTPYPSSKRRVQEDIIDTFMGGVEEYLQQLRRKK